MSESLTKLLSVSSNPIAGPPVADEIASLSGIDTSVPIKELCALLSDKNGFFLFESALLIRPLRNEQCPIGILEWNDPKLWKTDYRIELSKCVFFAEDIFGVQFCVKDNIIQSFDPETGRFKNIGTTLGSWAQWIFEKHKSRTGWPLAHQWQVKYGKLSAGFRLLPKVPFVCGGQFSIDNLYSLNDVEGMRFRASIANQLVNIPDGAKVVIKIEKHAGN
jgi:hypothetical protein